MWAAVMLALRRAVSMASVESAVQPIKMRCFNQPIPSTAEYMVMKAKNDQNIGFFIDVFPLSQISADLKS